MPLKNGLQHESTVKEVRKWYNKTQLTQAVNSITPSRKSDVNDIAYEAYKQIETYDVKLSNPFLKPHQHHTNKQETVNHNGSRLKTKKKMGL